MYYKVVNKELKSITGRIEEDTIQYEVGNYVQANERLEALGYGPLVFDHVESAIEFIKTKHKKDKALLYECKVKGIRKLQYRKFCFSNSNIRLLLKGLKWTNYEDGTWPKGTKMVGKVKLTREICVQCGSWSGLKWPRGSEKYCEECGWPDEDFNHE